jgi:hypothetical protein
MLVKRLQKLLCRQFVGGVLLFLLLVDHLNVDSSICHPEMVQGWRLKQSLEVESEICQGLRPALSDIS